MPDEVIAGGVSDAVGDILAERLAQRLAPGLSTSVAQRLLDSPRLGERARAWARTGAQAIADLPADDRMIADGGVEGFRRLSTLSGAVWNADRVRGLVLARDLQAFIDAHGPDAREAALRYAHLSPEPGTASDEPLDEAISRHGRACLAAWLNDLPASVALSLRMALPREMEADPDETQSAHGPGIFRAVAFSHGVSARAPDDVRPPA